MCHNHSASTAAAPRSRLTVHTAATPVVARRPLGRLQHERSTSRESIMMSTSDCCYPRSNKQVQKQEYSHAMHELICVRFYFTL